MAQIDYPPVQQALARVRELSADEETRRLAFVRERAVRDERNAMRGARDEGLQAGLRKGLRQGRQEGELAGEIKGRREGALEGQVALLERLLVRRFGPISQAVQTRLRAASADELASWAERCLEAPNLDDVFSVS